MAYLKSFVLILCITAGLACRNEEPPPDCFTGVRMYSDAGEIRHDFAGYPVFPFSTFVLSYPSGTTKIKVYASRPPRMIRNPAECAAAYKWDLEKNDRLVVSLLGDTIQLRNLADGLYKLSICDTNAYDCKRGYFVVGAYETIAPAPPSETPVQPRPRPDPNPPIIIDPVNPTKPEPTPPTLIPLEMSLSTGNDQLYTRESFSVNCNNCPGDAIWSINGASEQQRGGQLNYIGVERAGVYTIKVCDPSHSGRCREMSLTIKDDKSCAGSFTAGPLFDKKTDLGALSEDALPLVSKATVIFEPRVDCKLKSFDVVSKNLGINRIDIELRENSIVLQDNITTNLTRGGNTIDFQNKARKPYVLKRGHRYELSISGTNGVVDITELKPGKGSSSDCKLSGDNVIGNVQFCKMD